MSTMTEAAPAVVDPAEARKRRKEIMKQSLRADGEETAASKSASPGAASSEASSADQEALPPKKRKVHKESRQKKTQVRYDPEMPMEKDQLAAWRKEARRVRNRESAAASRQRIRDRINELEAEIGQWKRKYEMAMERLDQLERAAGEKTCEAV